MKKTIFTLVLLLVTLNTAHAEITQNLSLGMRGDQVKELQKLLKVEQTGYFGNVTRRAVIEFQKNNSLPATGFVGEKTRKALNATNVPKKVETTPISQNTASSTWKELPKCTQVGDVCIQDSALPATTTRGFMYKSVTKTVYCTIQVPNTWQTGYVTSKYPCGTEEVLELVQ